MNARSINLGVSVWLLQEGSQFCKGFGGIGGLLRYPVDLTLFEEGQEEEDGLGEDSDEDF